VAFFLNLTGQIYKAARGRLVQELIHIGKFDVASVSSSGLNFLGGSFEERTVKVEDKGFFHECIIPSWEGFVKGFIENF